jgi:DNA-binding MarR family transcriptional regulator
VADWAGTERKIGEGETDGKGKKLPGKKRSLDHSKELAERSTRKNPFDQLKKLLVRKKLRRRLSLTEDHILSVLLVRRARSAILGEQLFSDPAWDILLELYAARLGDREVSLEDVARSIDTPESTTKRWVKALEERGLVSSKRGSAEDDGVRISLTEQGADKIGDLADHWGTAFVSI